MDKEYSDLIRKRKSKPCSLSQTSRLELHDAVFQLISMRQNTDSLMSEILKLKSGNSDDREKTCSNQKMTLLLPAVSHCLYQEAMTKGQTSNIASAEMCAKKIIEIIQCNHGNSECKELLTPLNREKMVTCLQIIQRFIQEQQFHRSHFITVLTREVSLPLEVLWLLHTKSIVVLDNIINSKHSQEKFTQDLAHQLFQLSACEGNVPFKEEVIKGFICFLINHGFPEKRKKEETSETLKNFCISVLDEVTKNVLDKSKEKSLLTVSWFEPCTEISPVSLKKFCTHTLSLTMSYQPHLKVSQALKEQSNWKSAKVNTCISNFYKQLFIPFEAGEIVDLLQRILDRQEVNWETILTFLATFLVCFTEAPQLIKGHISKLLKDGLEDSDMENTTIGFLLARQCCVEGLHVFVSYSDWFQETFGDSCRSPASNRKSFTFLMRFLTDIVPYETARHLKVHILRPPYIPPKCRDLLSDYITLAKTRLADLKESLESGVVNSVSSDSTKEKCEQDVMAAVTTFESTGKIPSSVMEASIFRKPYFIGKFLPVLLKPRPIPDKPDTRMLMIEALRKCDKIPSALYHRYEEACKKETQQLLEGVFEGDEDDMEDLILDPVEQLQLKLDQLKDLIIKSGSGESNQNAQKVNEMLSIISEKIELNIPRNSQKVEADLPPLEISLPSPSISSKHIQTVDVLLNFVCKCLTFDLRNSSPQISWILQFTRMLLDHEKIHKSLFTRFFHLIHSSSDLKDHHLTGLSALAACFGVLQPLFPVITVNVCYVCRYGNTTGSFLDVLAALFPCNDASTMKTCWRFWSQYLKFIFLQFEKVSASYIDDKHGIIPPDLTRKFTFLCWRFLPELRSQKSLDTVSPEVELLPHTIYLSDKFQQCLKESSITFAGWLDFEMSVLPENDCLSYFDRHSYHEWAIHQNFLQKSENEGGFNYNYTRLSSVLFQAILNSHLRSSCDHLPVCNECKKKGDHSSRTSSLEFLSFLQLFVHHLRDNTDNKPSVPWLLQQLDAFLSSGDSNSLCQKQAKVCIFYRIIRLLPPYLFLSNELHVLPDEQTIQEVVSCIELHFVCLVQDCALPISVTSYLLQSVVTLTRSAGYSDVLKSLTTNKLLSISCLIHWDTVKSLLYSWNEEENKLFSHLYEVKLTFQRCLEAKSLNPVPSGQPSWLFAAELFAAAVNKKHVSVLESLISTAQKHHLDVMVSFCDLLLSYLSGFVSLLEKNSDVVALRRIFLKSLCSHHSILSSLLQENKQKDMIGSLLITDVCRCHTFLSLLTHLDAQNQTNILSDVINLECILKLFNKLCTKFETPAAQPIKTSQPILLPDLMAHVECIKEVLNLVPLSSLHALDKNLLLSCGYDVKLTVGTRIASGL